MKTKNFIKGLLLSSVIILSSCGTDSDPEPVGVNDCNGILNGPALIDDCGDCQQAYVYDVVSHTVQLLDDVNDVELGQTEILVMPDDASVSYTHLRAHET